MNSKIMSSFLRSAIVTFALCLTVSAQAPQTPVQTAPNDYVVGAKDVLTITSYDQSDLSGKFSVEADGTFTYPMIGRVKAGGLTLRQIEAQVKKQLKDGGFFVNPQITVSIEQYLSQKVFIIGEVRNPGKYVLSGNMSLIEVLAHAGSTLPSASGEIVIVHEGVKDPAAAAANPDAVDEANIVRVSLSDLERGIVSQNAILRDGDNIFVPRAESVYIFGQVKTPGAYSLQQKNTTILQALSLAGGITDRGSTNRIKIVRIVNGVKKEIKVKLTDVVLPRDTIIVGERFF